MNPHREEYSKKKISVEQALSMVKSGDMIWTSYNGLEPAAFMSKLHTIAPRVENVVLRHAGVYRPYPFVMDPACKGHIIPCTGFSDDYTRAMHDTRNTWFMPAHLSTGFARAGLEETGIDIFVCMVSPMDDQGYFRMSLSVIAEQEAAEMAKNLKPGEVMLLENLRFYAEEEGKPRGLAEDATDEEKKAAKKALKEGPQKEFVKKLASYADCYINDAFGTAHRAHASTALIADYFPNDKMFGYVMENELKAIDGIMLNPERPFCAILGGSKVSTKITIIENLLEKVDVLVLGGGMTYTFAAAEGGKVGNSICEPDQFQTALDILAKAKEKGVKVVMSPDALIADAFSADANTNVAPANNIPDGWEGVDIADEGKKVFREEILKCKTILWNGPVGVFEIDKFATGSRAVAEAIAEATSKGAYSLIGGGDSVACINKFGLADKVSYVSTGGGALLEYMEGKELPGVAAIRK